MIIAVDFDGTLQLSDGSANFRLIQSLKANQRGEVLKVIRGLAGRAIALKALLRF